MTQQQLKIAGLVTLGLTGLLHLIEMPEYYGEVHYIGILFGVSVLGAVISLYGILKDRAWGWMLGTAVAAGTLAGYVLSRTVGLPKFRENSWSKFLEPMGLATLMVEALFLIVVAQAFARSREGEPSGTLMA